MLSITNETQRASLPYLSLRFMAYAPSFILSNLSLGKNTIKTKFVIKILHNVNIT